MKMKTRTIARLLALLLVCSLLAATVACGKGGDVSPGNVNATTSGDSGNAGNAGNSGGNDAGGGNSSGGNSSGGGNTGGNAAASGKDTIVIGVTQDAGTLHPHQRTAENETWGIFDGLIYEPLWYVDNDGNMIYLLATSYEIVEPLVLHIHLREGVTFTNGADFDAEDALFSLISWNHREGQPAMFAQMDEEASKVLDKYTLELALNEFNINFFIGIGLYTMFDKETYDADALAVTPNGTGPYIVEDYVVNSHLNVTLRDDYWGTKPQTKTFQFVQLKEDSQRVNALQAGEVDVVSIPFQDVDYVKTLDDIDVNVFPSVDAQAVLFNISPFSVFHENRDARLAVAYAIDRDAIVRNVFFNYAYKARMPGPAHCTDIDDRFFEMGAYGHGYDPDLARQLAESSGLVNQEIRLINNGRDVLAQMCELIQANLKEIGVTANVVTLDMGSWAANLFDETKWDMCIDYSWAQNFLYTANLRYMLLWMSAESYYNYPWEGHDRAIYLLEEAPVPLTSMLDEKDRIELNYEITQSVIDEMLWFNIIDEMKCLAFTSGLKGNPLNIEGEMYCYRHLYWG